MAGSGQWESRPSNTSDFLSPLFSEEYTESGSSSSAFTGLGATTGKALMTLGKAVLLGVERIFIATHMVVVIRAFPHTNEEGSHLRNIDSIYDDVLEFSRPGMYSSEIRNKAMGYILGQIGMSETKYLVSAISRWHTAEIYFILSEILVQISPLWKPSSKPAFPTPLFNSYTGAQTWSRLSLVPLVLFFSKLIRTSHTMCGIVLNVGFLDVLLAISHAYDFSRFRGSSLSSLPPSYPHNQLFIACNAALLDIAAYIEYRELLSCHPIVKTWPSMSAPTNTFLRLPFTTRRKALLLGVQDDVPVLDDYSPYFGLTLETICRQTCISALPPKELLRSLTFGVAYDQALRVYLSRSTHKDNVALLTKLLQCMPVSTTPPAGEPNYLDGPSGHYQLLFCLHLIIAVSRIIPNGRHALVNAGVIKYLIRVLQKEIPDSYFAHIATHVNHSEIPQIIRESGLTHLVQDRGAAMTQIQFAIEKAFSALFPASSNPQLHWNDPSSSSLEKLVRVFPR